VLLKLQPVLPAKFRNLLPARFLLLHLSSIFIFIHNQNFTLMKRIFLLLPFVVILMALNPGQLTKDERKFAGKFLKESEKALADAVKGLSDAQLKYKPSADAWSIEDVVKHIAVTEKGLRMMMDATVKQAANPEKRSNIKATDQQVIQMLEDRSQKYKTDERGEPKNSSYATMEEALESFRTSRRNLIDYMKSTTDDLRNHVATTPAGEYDSYQMALFIGSHTNRHRKQIEEIKADPNFPAR
jgi:uncharacterized damage-inducible protein DinB